jgi:glycosyltransferase involved in cell wall biosynthesis
MSKGVIFFSSDDWQGSLKTSKYHMACQLAENGYKVLYVNSIGLRNQQISSGLIKKILSRLRVIVKGVQNVQDNIYVLTPFIIPFHRYRIVNVINKFILVITIRIFKWRLKISEAELWLFLPNHVSLVGMFNELVSLYYCVDEHILFEGVDTHAMKKMEDKLLRSVDLVVTTAKPLYISKQKLANECIYLPHGVNLHHFRTALDSSNLIPDELNGLSKPLVGFIGLIEEWIDLDIIAYSAKSHPNVNFIMIGKVAVDIKEYEKIPNIYFLGQIKFELLPKFCRQFSCGIMPFKINEMTKNVNPLKMREYLAAGLPVVSTALPEVEEFGEYVKIAKSPIEFSVKLKDTLNQNIDRKLISKSMDNDSWSARYKVLRNKINDIKDKK